MSSENKTKIKLNDRYLAILRDRGMNGSVLKQRPFDFKPVSFTSNVDGLKPKMFSSKRQLEWFEQFLEDPFVPRTYCLVSAPNDGMAKLLAAFMMQHAAINANSRVALPLWHDLTGGFNNPLINERNGKAQGASLLILNNVGSQSTQPKLEKLRDVLETYTDIPKVVVATGCDPYMFFTKYLYLPIHALSYMTTEAVKKVVL
jgi:hypothetical protein